MTITELLAQFANPETLKTLSFANKFLAGLVTTMLGMGITFIALIILQVLISCMDKIINRTSASPQEAAQIAALPTNTSAAHEPEESELIAVITAAIAVTMKTTCDSIVIRNIAKIEDRSPLWNRAGIIEQMNSRL